MNDLVITSRESAVVGISLPPPRRPVEVRAATMGDVPFIDSLQKPQTKLLGWMPAQQLEQKINAGQVLIADIEPRRHGSTEERIECSSNAEFNSVSPCLRGESVGYCIGTDQYFKRGDVGVIYQLAVSPLHKRSLIGATLVKATFERAAYGCRLFSCWCAQDIEANHFWESIGFIPLAFRTGSSMRRRIHIFWQRRIREGDTTTPYWFPSQTSGGILREARLVLPIPPRTHWSDVKPLVLPGQEEPKREIGRRKTLPKPNSLIKNAPRAASISVGGLHFETGTAAKPGSKELIRPPRQRLRNDPKLIAAARELRDRYLDEVNSGRAPIIPLGKYNVATPTVGAVLPEHPSLRLVA